ncbi:MAG: magnesium-translocating P-type ATPase [Eubacteriaceae bacterium]
MKNLLFKNSLTSVYTDCSEQTMDRMRYASGHSTPEIYSHFNTTEDGLSEENTAGIREQFGTNTVTAGHKSSALVRFIMAFVNPFTAVLCGIALISVFTDIVWVPASDKNYSTVLIIGIMILISGLMRFIQEAKSSRAAEELSKMIQTTTCVFRRETGEQEIPVSDVVVGDMIRLSAGDLIPADLRIISAKDLFVSQSALTGESEPVEKTADVCSLDSALTDCSNLAFMGSSVISGSARGLVVSVGNDTVFGKTARSLSSKPVKTSFDKGLDNVSKVLIRFMLVMVPVVLIANGLTKGDWLSAALFAVSVAVGLTPVMLPMLVTSCLAKGSSAMARRKVIIKNLNAVQNLGSIDILCTDKTGTLTQDQAELRGYSDIEGHNDLRVLRHAFLNSWFQTGLRNVTDQAVIGKLKDLSQENPQLSELSEKYRKIDEVPFDFNRRRMSVIVSDLGGKTQMITKGAVHEILAVCSFAEYRGNVVPLTEDMRALILDHVEKLNAGGMRAIAVAQKTEPDKKAGEFSIADEDEMVLIGYLTFLDPPKPTAAPAIRSLKKYGVDVKILTGDNERTAACICREVGLNPDHMLLGSDLDRMTDSELSACARNTSLFAKLTPSQKVRVVRVLREDGHTVGFMGDGINDAPAMKSSDVGISVDSAVDIAKETADVILMEKDLGVLENGIIEGRRTYASIIKYIKVTVSSNFGNMFSVLAASIFLPFLPMTALQLILLALIYDISCIGIPWDNVDPEFLEKPRCWEADSLSTFMIWMGPISSIFDITLFLLMYFVVCPAAFGGQLYTQLTDPSAQLMYVALFQAGWFIESMWSQSMVIQVIRTQKIPFIQSRPSLKTGAVSAAGIAAATIIPFTPMAQSLGFAVLPVQYFPMLAVIIVSYLLLAGKVKGIYSRRYGELL